MPDYTDDWMNPQRRSFSTRDFKHEDGKFYTIERKRVIPCTWVGDGPPTEWRVWSEHKTPEERDEALESLRLEHPMWHLRGRQVIYIDGRPHHCDPFEYKDF